MSWQEYKEGVYLQRRNAQASRAYDQINEAQKDGSKDAIIRLKGTTGIVDIEILPEYFDRLIAEYKSYINENKIKTDNHNKDQQ